LLTKNSQISSIVFWCESQNWELSLRAIRRGESSAKGIPSGERSNDDMDVFKNKKSTAGKVAFCFI
jgi:hypothetical protein